MTAATVKIILFCLSLGAGLVYKTIRRQKRVRSITDTPRSRTSSAAQGYVELEGFAWPTAQANTIPSKDGAEALYYSFQLQKSESRGSGKNRRTEWVTIFIFNHAEPFYLVDATGLALLDPGQAELDLSGLTTRAWRALEAQEKTRIAEKIIAGSVPNFPPSTFLFGLFAPNYRVIEKEIRVGSPLFASGDFRTANAAAEKVSSLGLTAFYNRVFDPTGRSVKNLSGLLDTNHDGKVSADELKAGYSYIAQSARVRSKLEGAAESAFDCHGYLGSAETSALFVADTDEKNLKVRLSKYLWAQFAVGSALITLGLVICLSGGLENLRLPARSQQSAHRVPARVQPNANNLHEGCIAGRADQCAQLLEQQNKLHLTPEHITYYRRQACTAGAKNYCP